MYVERGLAFPCTPQLLVLHSDLVDFETPVSGRPVELLESQVLLLFVDFKSTAKNGSVIRLG